MLAVVVEERRTTLLRHVHTLTHILTYSHTCTHHLTWHSSSTSPVCVLCLSLSLSPHPSSFLTLLLPVSASSLFHPLLTCTLSPFSSHLILTPSSSIVPFVTFLISPSLHLFQPHSPTLPFLYFTCPLLTSLPSPTLSPAHTSGQCHEAACYGE